MNVLAEISYPRIDPVLFHLGPLAVRWYGVSYILSFLFAFLILRYLAKKGRWPVAPDRVADVLFWGILGVFVGGRLGWVLFYGLSEGHFEWSKVYKVWEGGMSFHGGLLGVIIAYWIWTARTNTPRGAFFDGLSLATTPGLFLVRIANFVNAELHGRPWDGPWAMQFPDYPNDPTKWDGKTWQTVFRDGKQVPLLRHPSQLYEAMFEGLLLFGVLWWLLVKKNVSGGRISAAFLILYGTIRFLVEFTREPDAGIDLVLGLSRGQFFCLGMIVAGFLLLWRLRAKRRLAESGAA